MEPKEYHLFEKYLNNDLDRTERTAFEKRISSDPEFAATFEIYKSINDSLTAREARKNSENELRESLNKISAEFFDMEKEETSAKVIPLKRFFWAAAASVIIMLGVIFFFNQQKSGPTYVQFANYEPLALAERGTGDSLKLLAESAFNNGNYEQASLFLSQLSENDPANTELKLYLGIALTETEQFDQAQKLFREIQNGGSIFKYKATWYLALNFLKQNERGKCIEQLKNIPEEAEEYDKARELLDVL